FLAQGTLYSDVIESGSDTSQTIKSHHNVGGLPEDMEFELIEPLNKLFKDEVRQVGTALGITDYIVWRQPFTGTGLAIRVIGEVSKRTGIGLVVSLLIRQSGSGTRKVARFHGVIVYSQCGR